MGKPNNLATIKMLKEARKYDNKQIEKNYYNLGAFDTDVSNGDGATAIIRRVEYFKLDGSENWVRSTATLAAFFSVNLEGLILPPLRTSTAGSSNYRGNGVSNRFVWTHKENFNEIERGSICFGASSLMFYVTMPLDTTLEEFKKDLSQNKLIVQYELETPYTEIAIENQPIRIANQEENFYWNAEWRKGLNLIKPVTTDIHSFQVGLGTVYLKPNTTYYLKGSGFTLSATNNAAIRVTTTVLDINTNIETYYTDYSFNINNGGSFTTSNNLVAGVYGLVLRGTFSTATNGIVVGKVMLNEGDHPYSYVPYYGGLLREKDLSGIQLFPTDVNPAETIGGDWEDKGTTTTSDGTVLHVYRRL